MKKILVIEDEANLRRVVQINLIGSGYDVRTAENGEMGLETARVWQPDLMLLDIKMPGLSGWDVLERMKKSPSLSRIPALLMTAFVLLDEEDLKKSGVRGVLFKPFNVSELLKSVEEALRPPV